MLMRVQLVSASMLALAISPAALAQEVVTADADAPPTEEELAEEEVIVVTGGRPRGSVAGDFTPELQLNAGDVRALGISNVTELLEVLAAETASARGRGGEAAVLVNGTRVSGRSEIRGIPAEAIIRVDVLPEEAGLRYGFDAGQRVVNIVLRRRFDAVTAEAEGGAATAGGRLAGEVEAGYFNIRSDTRLTIDAEFEREAALAETERTIAREAGTDPLDARFRSLLPETGRASLNAAWVKPLGDISTLTLNGRADRNTSNSALGLDSATSDAIERERDALTTYAAALISRQNRAWPWTLTGRFERTDETIDTLGRPVVSGIAGPGARRERVDTTQQEGFLEAVVTGVPFALPAGEAALTVTATGRATSFDSRTIDDAGGERDAANRESGGAAFSLELPIASEREDVLGAVGRLSANVNGGYTRLSDFGGITSIGGGINWEPIEAIELIASITREEGPPTVRQLGLTQTLTPETRYFDFVRGETALVTLLDGGNPDLDADSRRVLKLGATVRPIEATRLSLSINYLNERTRRPIGSLPTATAEIEAAFPDRFVRDATGALVFVDTTPINFFAASSQQIRTGITWSESLERRRRPGEPERGPPRRGPGAPEAAGGAGEPGAVRGFGGGRFGGGAFGGGRLQLSLFHTWRLSDELQLAEGLQPLDLLGGDTVDVRARPRHELEARVSAFWMGFGARLQGRWQSARTVGSGVGELRFDDLATLDLDLFASLDNQRDLVRDHPWLRGVRVGIEVENIFDARQQVRDVAGDTPLRYQPALLDPLGRTIKIGIRKRF